VKDASQKFLALGLSVGLLFQWTAPVFAAEEKPSRPKVRQAFINFSELARREGMFPKASSPEAAEVAQPNPPVPGDGLILPGDTVLSPPPPPPNPLLQVPAPTTNSSFLALGDNGTAFPPDTHGAVGKTHLMVTLNSQVRIQTRSGGTVSTVSLSTFWNELGHSDVFDPKVVYDPYQDRWITTACADRQSATSSTLIGVSLTSDPTGSWNLISVDADSADLVWADYPGLGFNSKWIVVTQNMFRNSDNQYQRSHAYIFDKASLYNGGQGTISNSPLNLGSVGIVAPATTFDNSDSTPLYMLNVNGSGSSVSQIRLTSISGNTLTPSVSSAVIIPMGFSWHSNIGSNGSVFLIPQSGSSTDIEPNDHRMLSCIYRNGFIWGAHTVFLPSGTPTRSAISWFQLNTSGAIQQANRLDSGTSAGPHYSFPSLSVNKENDMLLGYSRGSASQFMSANYAFRFGTDTASTLRDDTVLKAGEATYVRTGSGTRNRWGDYSHTLVDPTNDYGMWTIQQYAASPSGGIDRWGTWWGQVVPADLSVTMSADKSKVGVKQELTYTITVSNVGGKNYTGVTLTDTLPSGVAFVSATTSQGTCSGSSTITCNIGSMATGGANVTVTVVVEAQTVGTATNHVSVTANESDGNSSNDSASVTTTINPVTTVYPNPWRPGAAGDFGSANNPCGNGLVFEAAPGTTVRVYTMQGDLVHEHTLSASDAAAPADPANRCRAWDGKNDSGSTIASGIYMAVLSGPGGEEVRRIAVEK
jgi:uncharacterized repeat protein (TIGR01451 family)